MAIFFHWQSMRRTSIVHKLIGNFPNMKIGTKNPTECFKFNFSDYTYQKLKVCYFKTNNGAGTNIYITISFINIFTYTDFRNHPVKYQRTQPNYSAIDYHTKKKTTHVDICSCKLSMTHLNIYSISLFTLKET